MSIPRRRPRRRRGAQGQEGSRTPRGDTPARGAQRINRSRSNSPAVRVAHPPSVEVAVDRSAAVAGAAGGGDGAGRARVSLTANPNRSPTRSPSPWSPSPGGRQSPSGSPRRLSPRGGDGGLIGAQEQAGGRASPSPAQRAAASPSPRGNTAPDQNSQRRDGGRDQIQTRGRTQGQRDKGKGKGRGRDSFQGNRGPRR